MSEAKRGARSEATSKGVASEARERDVRSSSCRRFAPAFRPSLLAPPHLPVALVTLPDPDELLLKPGCDFNLVVRRPLPPRLDPEWFFHAKVN